LQNINRSGVEHAAKIMQIVAALFRCDVHACGRPIAEQSQPPEIIGRDWLSNQLTRYCPNSSALASACLRLQAPFASTKSTVSGSIASCAPRNPLEINRRIAADFHFHFLDSRRNEYHTRIPSPGSASNCDKTQVFETLDHCVTVSTHVISGESVSVVFVFDLLMFAKRIGFLECIAQTQLARQRIGLATFGPPRRLSSVISNAHNSST
jgi:hypothetical protein